MHLRGHFITFYQMASKRALLCCFLEYVDPRRMNPNFPVRYISLLTFTVLFSHRWNERYTVWWNHLRHVVDSSVRDSDFVKAETTPPLFIVFPSLLLQNYENYLEGLLWEVGCKTQAGTLNVANSFTDLIRWMEPLPLLKQRGRECCQHYRTF